MTMWLTALAPLGVPDQRLAHPNTGRRRGRPYLRDEPLERPRRIEVRQRQMVDRRVERHAERRLSGGEVGA